MQWAEFLACVWKGPVRSWQTITIGLKLKQWRTSLLHSGMSKRALTDLKFGIGLILPNLGGAASLHSHIFKITMINTWQSCIICLLRFCFPTFNILLIVPRESYKYILKQNEIYVTGCFLFERIHLLYEDYVLHFFRLSRSPSQKYRKGNSIYGKLLGKCLRAWEANSNT